MSCFGGDYFRKRLVELEKQAKKISFIPTDIDPKYAAEIRKLLVIILGEPKK